MVRLFFVCLAFNPALSNTSLANVTPIYIFTALLHHPDTARTGEEQKPSSEFIKVAEAWSILSKPDNRSRYDLLRNAHLGLSPSTLSPDGTYISSEPVGFTEMKNNYTYNIQRKAGASIEDSQEKLRAERWHELPLKQRKVIITNVFRTTSTTSIFCKMYQYLRSGLSINCSGISVPESIWFWIWSDEGPFACFRCSPHHGHCL